MREYGVGEGVLGLRGNAAFGRFDSLEDDVRWKNGLGPVGSHRHIDVTALTIRRRKCNRSVAGPAHFTVVDGLREVGVEHLVHALEEEVVPETLRGKLAPSSPPPWPDDV